MKQRGFEDFIGRSFVLIDANLLLIWMNNFQLRLCFHLALCPVLPLHLSASILHCARYCRSSLLPSCIVPGIAVLVISQRECKLKAISIKFWYEFQNVILEGTKLPIPTWLPLYITYTFSVAISLASLSASA